MNIRSARVKAAMSAAGSVLLLSLSSGRAAEALWVSGITEPVNDVTMSSPVIGIISARFFEEGGFVKKGQVIVELDKRIEELEVSRRKLIRDLANTELDRAKSLSARSAISISQEELDKKDAESRVAEVEYELAGENLRRRLLIAPFDGAVVEYFLEVGEACEARQPVLRIADSRRCLFVTNVESRIGHGWRAGQQVRLEIEAGGALATFEGRVKYVSPVVDPASGLLKVKVAFDNPNESIRPGVAGRMLVSEVANAR